MTPSNNIEVVHQQQMLVAWIKLREMKVFTNKVKTNKRSIYLIRTVSKMFLFKNTSNHRIDNFDRNHNNAIRLKTIFILKRDIFVYHYMQFQRT